MARRPQPFWLPECKWLYDLFWSPSLTDVKMNPILFNSPEHVSGRRRDWFSKTIFDEAPQSQGVNLHNVARFLFRYCDHSSAVPASVQQMDGSFVLKKETKGRNGSHQEWMREVAKQNTVQLGISLEEVILYKKGVEMLKQKTLQEKKKEHGKKRKLEEPDLFEIFQEEEKKASDNLECDLKAIQLQKRHKVTNQPAVGNDPSKARKKKTKTKSEKPIPNASRKIQLNLSPSQKSIAKQWLGASRWIYNQCIILCRHGLRKPAESSLRLCFANEQAVQRVVNQLQTKGLWKWKKEDTPYDASWLFKVPAKIRDQAIRDYVNNFRSSTTAMKTSNKKRKSGSAKQPKFKFRSLKAPQQSVTLPCQDWGSNPHKSNTLGIGNLGNKNHIQAFSASEDRQIPDKTIYDSKLTRTRQGKYYLCLPFRKPHVFERTEGIELLTQRKTLRGIICLDPGVRTFLTGYDPSGLIYQWGNKDMSRICRLAKHYDNLQSKAAKADNHGTRYRMRKAGRRLQIRIRNLIDEVHKKVTLFLVKNYQVVILPEFNAKDMVRKLARRIPSKVVRQLLTWSHYRFRQRLLHKQKEYPWCRVILTDEAYTSKTCGKCGHIHKTLGGNKVFKCPSCKHQAERDIHAARNIWLRFLSKLMGQSCANELLRAFAFDPKEIRPEAFRLSNEMLRVWDLPPSSTAEDIL